MNDEARQLRELLQSSHGRRDRYDAVKKIAASGNPETAHLLIPLLRQPALGNEISLVLQTLGKFPGKVSEKALVAFLPFASSDQKEIIMRSLIGIGSFDAVAGTNVSPQAIEKIKPLILLSSPEKIQELLDGKTEKLVEETERIFRQTSHWRRKK